MKVEIVKNTRLIAEIQRELSKKIKVGFLKDDENHDIALPALAELLHKGDSDIGIPPRPFFSNFERNYSGHMVEGFKYIIKAACEGKSSHDISGLIFKRALMRAIEDYRSDPGTINPHNTKLTAKKKGFDKVFTEDGYLVEGVDYEIVSGKQ